MKSRFLFASAFCLFAWLQAPAQSSDEKLGWNLAVHSYTFQKFSIFEAIDKTAAIGIRHMSVSGNVNLPGTDGQIVKGPTINLSGEDTAKIADYMKQKGIDPVFVNMGVVKPSMDEAGTRKIFEGAKRMGINVLVVEPETHGKMEELAQVMDVVEKLAIEFNIKIAIHNHPQPSFYWNPDTILAAVNGRSPLLGACADVGHWVRSGLDPVESLKKLEGRVITLHFKDLNEKNKTAHDVPWGTGVSNTKGMLAELKRQNFKGAICVEYEHNWENSLPEIAESVKWFNEACAALAPQKAAGK